jgi:hypothetical protein
MPIDASGNRIGTFVAVFGPGARPRYLRDQSGSVANTTIDSQGLKARMGAD